MASVEQRDLIPDKILTVIFSGTPSVTLASCNILSNTFDTCTFSIHLDVAPLPSYPNDLIVRLETSRGRLPSVASLQRLGHAQLPDFVPLVLDVGATTTADGRPVEYSVTAYCTGTISLEDIWDTISPAHQSELVASVVRALKRLQKLDLTDEDVRSRVNSACRFDNGASLSDCLQPAVKAWLGGPNLGYFPDIKQLLGGILQASNQRPPPNCTLSESDDEGITLESAFEGIGRVEFTRSDLDDLQHHVVFCHNDLEPRNILVKETSLPNDDDDHESPRFELAAIIDWEMAGFYPFSYEYSVKDTVLGSSNLSFSWYSLFKERASHLFPQAECHTKLIQALRIIDESKKSAMARNVGVRVQAKWVERESVERSSDLRQGWVRKASAKVPGPFTKDDKANLEMEVLRELGYV